MGLRTFDDTDGKTWHAWDVHPMSVERRMNHPAEVPSDVSIDATDHDRRHRTHARFTLPDTLREGWIAFECGEDNRRLAPIPSDWETMPDDALRELLHRAQVAPARHASRQSDRSGSSSPQ